MKRVKAILILALILIVALLLVAVTIIDTLNVQSLKYWWWPL